MKPSSCNWLAIFGFCDSGVLGVLGEDMSGVKERRKAFGNSNDLDVYDHGVDPVTAFVLAGGKSSAHGPG